MIAQRHFPTTATAMAFGLPLNDGIQRVLQSARDLDSANKTAKECEQYRKSGFGQRIALAVQSKVSRPRTAVFAESKDDDEDEDDDKEKESSFGKRIKKAVKERSSAQRHKEYAERERERYEEQRKQAVGE